jgi:hypothetical protein
MAKCKHKNTFYIADDRGPHPVKWCVACGAIFIRFETERGTVSRRPKWILPKPAKP